VRRSDPDVLVGQGRERRLVDAQHEAADAEGVQRLPELSARGHVVEPTNRNTGAALRSSRL
jgi:hypothetical protein